MDAILRALTGATRAIVHPVILVVLLVPMLLALAAWAAIAWYYWDTWSAAIQSLIVDQKAFAWRVEWDTARWAAVIAVVLILILLAPAVIITALLIAAVFAMPVLVSHVARQDFPGLDRRHGGTVFGSAWNALVALVTFLLLWVVTLPLWLLGPLVAIVPLLLSAWLNQRLFRYDALSEHASAVEMQQIFDRARGRLFALGLITGALYFIPPLNLVGPVFAALAFVYLCLEELQQLRAGEREK